MTHKVKLKTEFIVPEDVDKENVKYVLNEYFGDLIRTDRFIDARVVEDGKLTDGQEERFINMMSNVKEEDLEELSDFIEEYTSQDG